MLSDYDLDARNDYGPMPSVPSVKRQAPHWLLEFWAFMKEIIFHVPAAVNLAVSIVAPFANFIWKTFSDSSPIPEWIKWCSGYVFLLTACFLAWRHGRRKRLAMALRKSLDALERLVSEDVDHKVGVPGSKDWWTQPPRLEVLGRQLRAHLDSVEVEAHELRIDGLEPYERLNKIPLKQALERLQRTLNFKPPV